MELGDQNRVGVSGEAIQSFSPSEPTLLKTQKPEGGKELYLKPSGLPSPSPLPAVSSPTQHFLDSPCACHSLECSRLSEPPSSVDTALMSSAAPAAWGLQFCEEPL